MLNAQTISQKCPSLDRIGAVMEDQTKLLCERIREYRDQQLSIQDAHREMDRRIRRYHLRRYLRRTGYVLVATTTIVVLIILWFAGYVIP